MSTYEKVLHHKSFSKQYRADANQMNHLLIGVAINTVTKEFLVFTRKYSGWSPSLAYV